MGLRCEVKDMLMVLPDTSRTRQNVTPVNTVHDTGSLAFAFITTRKDALQSDPYRNIGEPVVMMRLLHIWSWVRNSSICRRLTTYPPRGA